MRLIAVETAVAVGVLIMEKIKKNAACPTPMPAGVNGIAEAINAKHPSGKNTKIETTLWLIW